MMKPYYTKWMTVPTKVYKQIGRLKYKLLFKVTVYMFIVWLCICIVHTMNISYERDNKMIIFQKKSLVPTDNIKQVWYLSLKNRWYKSVENRPIFHLKNRWLFTPNDFPSPIFKSVAIGGRRWLSVAVGQKNRLVWIRLKARPNSSFLAKFNHPTIDNPYVISSDCLRLSCKHTNCHTNCPVCEHGPYLPPGGIWEN